LDNNFTPTTVSQFFTYIPPAVDITSHGSSNPEKATDTNSVKVSKAWLGEKESYHWSGGWWCDWRHCSGCSNLRDYLVVDSEKEEVDKSRRRERPKIRLVG
jgi:hypothetical protein